MRISDWSSDVCSSDLQLGQDRHEVPTVGAEAVQPDHAVARRRAGFAFDGLEHGGVRNGGPLCPDAAGAAAFCGGQGERKSVGSGKSVSVRVDLGGWRILKKKTYTTVNKQTQET